ncbi:ribosomal protein S18 acetylase RimI-like enzyme [Streptomyces pratensis]|nr:ribosomal protein S18 acetylase RimI-like enzyme [Streptomyces pratensis]
MTSDLLGLTVLDRRPSGDVDYLTVCAHAGIPIARGGVDYRTKGGAGTLWQLAVHPALQSCGVGTILVEALEQRIRRRGLCQAELGVEDSNPGARALYERLGHRAYDYQLDAWEEQAPDGTLHRHETMGTVMRKHLS